ncbi:SDR family NAD(P)-dependent oxidoreductase [Haliea sp. E17]|uniref:SDR family NAD(P)-dependent oxidoreductase n=1 Tax=Haliea sp. E17 TaxID=3401576 RepID=UPI003AAC1D1E
MNSDHRNTVDNDNQPVYLVTGGSGAIGKEISAQAATAGVRVAVHGSTPESAEVTVADLQQRHPAAELLACSGNFLEAGAIASLVDQAAAHWGRLDGVIHCAITGAPGVTGPFAASDPSAYGAHAARVLASFQQLCFHALPHLSRSAGAIIGFTSDAGRFAAARQSLIAGANGGLISFVRSLAVEIAADGVRVNCISPGFVENTPSFEKFGAGGRGDTARKRAGLGLPRTEDIAPLALFLCSPGAGKITGQVISINGGVNA